MARSRDFREWRSVRMVNLAGLVLAVCGAARPARERDAYRPRRSRHEGARRLTRNQRRIVEEHLALADVLASRRKRHSVLELEELVSLGRMGLIEAAQRFDESRGIPFAAYARHRIVGFMLDTERRERWRRRNVSELDDSHADGGPGPDEAAAVSEQIESLARLDGRTRRVLRERLRGKSLRQIGEELGLSEARVYQITRDAKAQVLEEPVDEEIVEELTPAQVETLRGAARGETASETAGRLGKSVWTVRSQKMEALRRLGARSTTHAVVRALRRGILSLDDVADPWASTDLQT